MDWQEYEYEFPRPVIRFGPKLTPAVKLLIVVNVAVFIVQSILGRIGLLFRVGGVGPRPVEELFCVVPKLLVRFPAPFIWQLFTYMFLHARIWHILLNLLILWMLGSEVEARLGRRRFLHLYLLSGVGAGLCHALTSWGSEVPMLGASGAVFGVMIAYAMLFPDRHITLLLLFVLPLTLKAKHLLLGLALLEVLAVISAGYDGVAHFTHLGGLLFGYLYMKSKFGLPLPYAFAERFSYALRGRWLSRRSAKYRYKPIDADEFISQEVDPILAKISHYGIGSLTRKERRILKKARAQMK